MFAFVDPAPLPLPRPLLIGRSAECHVCFHGESETMVSRRHGELCLSATGAQFVDRSSQGSFLVGKRERISTLAIERGTSMEVQFGPDGPIVELAVGVAIPFGHYSLLAKLGEGGMAEVYVAADHRLNRLVVLKLLRPEVEVEDPQAQQSLLDEAKIVAQLEHTNVVRVYELGELGGVPFIAMEYLRGISLAQLESQLKKQGKRLPPPLAAAIIRQACLGLHAAHELPARVVHRDISHNNIIVTRDGVKVIDFGIARSSKADRHPVTAPHVTKGCPPYMSPEQISSPHSITRLSDIFSTAVVLYELCAGTSIFSRDNHLATMEAVLHHEPPPLRSVCSDASVRLEQTLQSALAKNPIERRPTTAAELAAILKEEAGVQLLQHESLVAALESMGVVIYSPPPLPLVEEPRLVRRAMQFERPKLRPMAAEPVPGPSANQQNPQLASSQSLLDPMEVVFKKLDWFRVDAPKIMNVGCAHVVRAGAIRELLQRGFAEYAGGDAESADAEVDTLPFGRLLKLDLIADEPSCFTIRALSPADQPLLRNELSSWDWLVIPHRAGEAMTLRVVADDNVNTASSQPARSRVVSTLAIATIESETAMGMVGLPTASLRSLIETLLPGGDEVDRFCSEHFPDIRQRFGPGMDRSFRVSLLLGLATGSAVIATLRSKSPQVVGMAEAQAALNAGRAQGIREQCTNLTIPAKGGSVECSTPRLSRLLVTSYDVTNRDFRDPVALDLALHGLVNDCPRPLTAAVANRLLELRVASETLKAGRSFRIYPSELTTSGARNSYTLPLPCSGKQLFVGHHRGEHRVIHVASSSASISDVGAAILELPELGVRLAGPAGTDRLFVIYTLESGRSDAYLSCFALRRE